MLYHITYTDHVGNRQTGRVHAADRPGAIREARWKYGARRSSTSAVACPNAVEAALTPPNADRTEPR